jgi:hypothetical protein
MALQELAPLGEVQLELDRHDLECFAEVRDVLARHGRLDRFGIVLLHRHFDIADDERLVETTDVNERVQTVRVHKAESLAGVKTIDTAWRLHPEGVEAMAECIVTCHGPSTQFCEEQKHSTVKKSDDDD